MLRLAVCVLALSACDAVFGLSTKDVELQPCGPYGPATPLQFSADLQSPHNFSIGSDAAHGSVVQLLGPSPVVTAVALGSDGVWAIDAARNASLPVAPNSGRIVTDGDLYATETADTTRLDERTFVDSNAQWATDGLVMTDPRFDLDIGNVVTQFEGSDAQNHFGIVLESTQDASQAASTLVVIQRAQPFASTQWQLNSAIIAPLATDSHLAEIGQGVVTLDHHAIVYAASYETGGDLDLFISAFDRASETFPTGTLLDSVSEPGTDDSAPSIDATCSTLYFERDGRTLMAVSEGERIVSRDQPWIFRTYAGHSNTRASNELYRRNLAAGQTGLSIAFDLPTQCGYDPDHPLARPEVGKVGVPIASLDDMHALFDGIPIETMNTSMTINGTAAWLLALYVALARERGVDERVLRGTTQNDIVKEYLARGTYIFPPEPSLELVAETYEYCVERMPQWNPSNVCSYHLQEAGATPVQELAFALANAVGVLDRVKARGRVDAAAFEQCVGRVSFFVNAGMRFVEEMCKMRAFAQLWDELCRERFGVTDPKLRQLRYGVQVGSLPLTEQQPEVNAWRILIEALGVVLSRDARCRALQLPTWNEALSLPRPWDQQWSLRLQQVLAYETDLLEYGDLFAGSPVVAAKVESLARAARVEMARIAELGGIRAAVETGYCKRELVRAMAERAARIERGEQIVVGVNKWTEGLPSPLVGGDDGGVFKVDASAAEAAVASCAAARAKRDPARAKAALAALAAAARAGRGVMEASIECALARVTTGEWSDALRAVWGDYRADTGVAGAAIAQRGDGWDALRARVAALPRRPRLLVGKPGLDGHSNGAEVVAVAARDAGFEVIYAGIRAEPAALAATAVQESVDVIGLSVLSGSHIELATAVLAELRTRGAADVPVVVGGTIPAGDRAVLAALGVKRVFTPSDYKLVDVIGAIVDVIATAP